CQPSLCPKTPETVGMFNAARLRRMKPSSYLIKKENAQDIPRGLFAHPIDGFPGNACDMRRDDDIGKFGQRIGYRRRLLLEDIEPRAGKLAGRKCIVKRCLIDDAASCCVDQIAG